MHVGDLQFKVDADYPVHAANHFKPLSYRGFYPIQVLKSDVYLGYTYNLDPTMVREKRAWIFQQFPNFGSRKLRNKK